SGVLRKDFSLYKNRTQALIETSQNLKFTFHRAFDWVKNPMETSSLLEAMGVHTLLTSGQASSAEEGIDLLTELNQQSTSMTIMPGGGIRPKNIHLFKEAAFKAVHLSASRFVQNLSASPKIPMNSPSFLREDAIAFSDPEIIRKVVEAVK
ncbi:MAG: copper homeostasis protein CutC, partial [Pricia sp.]